ncbi:hypothetical protein VB775_14540, partial [Pseudanabaena sp. CCNP1317]|nr:hypothetical protein [Pseudanabaena sp. CCNP1317]
MPKRLTQGTKVLVLADTEFCTVKFLNLVRAKAWRVVVGIRCNRKLQDGRSVKQLYRHGKRGQQVLLEGLSTPFTISWFWLKRADSKRELRFVISSHPYSGAYSGFQMSKSKVKWRENANRKSVFTGFERTSNRRVSKRKNHDE